MVKKVKSVPCFRWGFYTVHINRFEVEPISILTPVLHFSINKQAPCVSNQNLLPESKPNPLWLTFPTRRTEDVPSFSGTFLICFNEALPHEFPAPLRPISECKCTGVLNDGIHLWFGVIKKKYPPPHLRTDILRLGMQEELQFISSQGVTCMLNNSSGICRAVSCSALIRAGLSLVEPSVLQEKITDNSEAHLWMGKAREGIVTLIMNGYLWTCDNIEKGWLNALHRVCSFCIIPLWDLDDGILIKYNDK